MLLARVVGNLVSSHKVELLEGLRFLVLEKVDAATLRGKSDFLVAIDSVGANEGELVFYVGGSSARMTGETKGRPSDATIVAIVDTVELGGKAVYLKSAGTAASGQAP
jgi:microcompartment protein CcmK/EutM